MVTVNSLSSPHCTQLVSLHRGCMLLLLLCHKLRPRGVRYSQVTGAAAVRGSGWQRGCDNSGCSGCRVRGSGGGDLRSMVGRARGRPGAHRLLQQLHRLPSLTVGPAPPPQLPGPAHNRGNSMSRVPTRHLQPYNIQGYPPRAPSPSCIGL